MGETPPQQHCDVTSGHITTNDVLYHHGALPIPEIFMAKAERFVSFLNCHCNV